MPTVWIEGHILFSCVPMSTFMRDPAPSLPTFVPAYQPHSPDSSSSLFCVEPESQTVQSNLKF